MKKLVMMGMLVMTLLTGCTSDTGTETVSKKEQSIEHTEKIFTKRDIKKAEQIGLDFFTTVEEQKTYAFRDIEDVQDQLQEKNMRRFFVGKEMMSTNILLPKMFGMNSHVNCTDKPTDNMCTVQYRVKQLKVEKVEEKYYPYLGVHTLVISYSHPKPNTNAKEISMYLEFLKQKDGKITIYEGDFVDNIELSKYNEDARYDDASKEKLRKKIEKDGVQ
ncbi:MULTISPECIES: hypothetical protein [Bacillus cereus group]|uniref:Lipoprotein n=1 Tax=Bacillus cereus TaxID=1396 RepID=A0AAW5L509_BACCE|nr:MULTISPECIES: hypothetical protein [Bacillus cereus group]MCQ6288515.1 hypothetical protein [Bacillus cereus]MCQ6304909.1 hypothetical protein [Bacillus cereus]MCQ6317658.1 hypothetical protein [Bacillus cereus]MCQ6329018.1 hypothetical protein [Bacillus cereus]MCQ6385642.1 hypothetical protein [Bacillus cereus]